MLSLTERPRKLNDVIAHTRTVDNFKKRSLSKNYPQVMMFTGPTGTGKTTLGYIIASLINCTNLIKHDTHYEPCNECKSCKSVIKESFNRSIIFRDGASMGKDDVVALEELCRKSPMYEENLVVVIEEAQAIISESAKAKLLKFIEKERKNLYFIFLSMNNLKLPTAVKDRGQLFKFKKLSFEDISEYIFNLLNRIDPDEKIPETFFEVINLIADNCHGSLRKALQDFEQCIYSEIYTKEIAFEELDYDNVDKAYNILLKLASFDKMFFDEVKKVESVEKFFYYTWKILCNISLNEMFNDYKNDFMERNGKKIVATKNLDNLLDLYNDVFSSMPHYFNENVFYTKALQFFKTKPVSQRVPV